ncbi:hypothetical protein [Sphingomonas cavernae]|uniref:C-type lysozyme inhibitor domain-containing protein n=1 Tax=Sphingomonas cavernae TaxID=2320861 RepID=A0A418WNA5_9SPHN|nr:hypothetical protein [Sphingomonas cavernae]RJF91494.1 hypothetical protein D3876_09795 [Sphingomonas cavernae]
MHSILPVAAASALLALAACNTEPETVTGGGPQDDMAAELANAAPVELPPSMKESKTYRCKDNTLVYVDFLSDDKSANIRLDKSAAPTQVKAEEAGKPMIAEGYSLEGSGPSVTITLPGKGSQSCKA